MQSNWRTFGKLSPEESYVRLIREAKSLKITLRCISVQEKLEKII